mgnify:CR=1 FL=1
MNWLTNYIKPKLQSLVKKRDIPKNLWLKCQCGTMIYHKDYEKSLGVCDQCGTHIRLSSNMRLQFLCDEGKYEKIKVSNNNTKTINVVQSMYHSKSHSREHDVQNHQIPQVSFAKDRGSKDELVKHYVGALKYFPPLRDQSKLLSIFEYLFPSKSTYVDNL